MLLKTSQLKNSILFSELIISHFYVIKSNHLMNSILFSEFVPRKQIQSRKYYKKRTAMQFSEKFMQLVVD